MSIADSAASLRATQMVRKHLRPGEELMWSGTPDRAALLSPVDAFVIPISVLYLSSACIFEILVTRSNSVVGELLGVPIFLLALYTVVGRFAYKRISHSRTAYGVTRDRAIIVTPRTVRDLPLAGVRIAVRRSRSGRRASVAIGTQAPAPEQAGLAKPRAPSLGSAAAYANTGLEPLMRSAVWPFAFYDVDNPDAMLAAIDRARTGTSW